MDDEKRPNIDALMFISILHTLPINQTFLLKPREALSFVAPIACMLIWFITWFRFCAASLVAMASDHDALRTGI